MSDWLKVRHALIRSAKIRMLMRELRCNKMTALGLALTWLCWIDEQTEDGQTHLSPDELADELGFRGCANALCSIGWAALGEDGCVVALEFGKHCGDSAKKRALDAERQQKSRLKRDTCHATCHTKSVTESVTNVTPPALPEENRKEENKNISTESHKTTVVLTADLPGCPDDVTRVMKALMLGNLQGDKLTECAARFMDDCNASGWLDRRGMPIRDWKAAARNYARRYAENLARRTLNAKGPAPNNSTPNTCNNANDYR